MGRSFIYLSRCPICQRAVAPAPTAQIKGRAFQRVSGKTGQQFDEQALTVIQQVRSGAPELPIAVDGGMTPEVAARCKQAGATQIAVGAYIFNASNPTVAYQEFLKAAAE